MAEINLFSYFYKDSVIHKIDGRIKLLAILLLSIAVNSSTKLLELTFFSIFLFSCMLVSQLPVKLLLKNMKYFIFLLVIVIMVNAFTIEGKAVSNFPLFSISIEGLIAGLRYAWQIILIIILCTIITSTTTLLSIRNSVEWYLRPVPFIYEFKVATMISLTFVLVPVIFKQISEMITAQKARCIEGRKNIIKRILFLVFPLLIRTFKRADEIVFAMEARCYSQNRTKAVFAADIKDFIALFVILVMFNFTLFY